MSPTQVNHVGPGTHLHRLLAAFGFAPRAGCSCEDRMAEMDRQGSHWCCENLDEIVAWLVEQAHDCQFLGVLTRIAPGTTEVAARQIVWHAIGLAEGGRP